MFHFDRKLQQEKVDTSSGDNPSSDGSTPPDGNASPDNCIEVITSAEDE